MAKSLGVTMAELIRQGVDLGDCLLLYSAHVWQPHTVENRLE